MTRINEQADDRALVAAASIGDRDAFSAIVNRHGRSMFRYARRMLHDAGDAEDVTQEALVAAWRGLPDYRGEASLRTWLFTLTARKAIDLGRRRRPLPIAESALAERLQAGAASAADSDPGGLAGLLRALDAALLALPWRQRACWLLREVEGLSYDEIGAVLGCAEPVVRGQLARGRAELRRQLEAWR